MRRSNYRFVRSAFAFQFSKAFKDYARRSPEAFDETRFDGQWDYRRVWDLRAATARGRALRANGGTSDARPSRTATMVGNAFWSSYRFLRGGNMILHSITTSTDQTPPTVPPPKRFLALNCIFLSP